MVIQNNYMLFEDASAPGVSKVRPNPQGDICYLTITGDFTTVEVVFEGKARDTFDFTPVGGVNVTDFSVEKGTYTRPGTYSIEIAGMRKIRARLISVTGGTATVYAQLIKTSEV